MGFPPLTLALSSAQQNSGVNPIPMHVFLSQTLCFSVLIHLRLLPSLSVPVSAHLGLSPFLSLTLSPKMDRWWADELMKLSRRVAS